MSVEFKRFGCEEVRLPGFISPNKPSELVPVMTCMRWGTGVTYRARQGVKLLRNSHERRTHPGRMRIDSPGPASFRAVSAICRPAHVYHDLHREPLLGARHGRQAQPVRGGLFRIRDPRGGSVLQDGSPLGALLHLLGAGMPRTAVGGGPELNPMPHAGPERSRRTTSCSLIRSRNEPTEKRGTNRVMP